MTDDERQAIAFFLLASCNDGKQSKGKFHEAAEKWNVSRRTIGTLWQRTRQQLGEGNPINIASLKKVNNGKKRIQPDIQQIMSIKKNKRSTLKGLSEATGMPISTAHRWVQREVLRSHTNAMHPDITAEQKLLRLNFSVSHLIFDMFSRVLKYQDMKQIVHIDEKWFYMSKVTRRYYKVSGEDVPYRSCKSKRYITKVMFLCAVARPRYGEDGEVLFDEKIGCFPFTEKVPAQRSSKNRPAGTMVTKPIERVTKEVTKDMIINKLIPAIKQKWPVNASKEIVIQQDNARPHITGSEPDFISAAQSDGFHINLKFQPPNSPDLNVLDLGFFRAIQALQTTIAARNVDELVEAVNVAYDKLDAKTLNNVFITLQAVMTCVMQRRGHNDFSLPHIRKDAQRRQGLNIEQLTVDECLVKECLQHLHLFRKDSNLQHLAERLGCTFEV